MSEKCRNRRRFLRGAATTTAVGLAGCLRLTGGQRTPGTASGSNSNNTTATTTDGATNAVSRVTFTRQWEVPLLTNIVKATGDLFILIESKDGSNRIDAYTKDGKNKWTAVTGSISATGRRQAAIANSTVYVGEYNRAEMERQVSTGTVLAFSITGSNQGSKLWGATMKGSVNAVDAAGSLCVAGTNSPDVNAESKNTGRVYGIDTSSGNVRWSNETFEQEFVHDVVVHETGVVVGTSNRVVRLDPETGKIRAQLSKFSIFGGGMSVDGDRLYLAGDSTQAIDLASATVAWETSEVPEEVDRTAPAVSSQHDQVVVATRTRRVLSYDSATGDVLWEGTTPSRVEAMPRLWKNLAFVVDSGGAVSAFDMANGGRRATTKFKTSAPFTFVDGTVFFGGTDNTAYSVQPITS